jgi:GNAT superfamily N-acetyltransferase
MKITIDEERPDTPEALQLIEELEAELHSFGYPAESMHGFSPDKLIREGVAFFLIRLDEQPVGCGAIKLFGAEYGEVKRMYVQPTVRGKGLAKAMLNKLSEHALQNNVQTLRLETGIYQVDAIRLYERCRFVRRPPFGEYWDDPLSVYFEKILE